MAGFDFSDPQVKRAFLTSIMQVASGLMVALQAAGAPRFVTLSTTAIVFGLAIGQMIFRSRIGKWPKPLPSNIRAMIYTSSGLSLVGVVCAFIFEARRFR